MNSEHLMQIEGAPKVALGSLIETLDVRGGVFDSNEIEGVNIKQNLCAYCCQPRKYKPF